jgi:hypothetical protein
MRDYRTAIESAENKCPIWPATYEQAKDDGKIQMELDLQDISNRTKVNRPRTLFNRRRAANAIKAKVKLVAKR